MSKVLIIGVFLIAVLLAVFLAVYVHLTKRLLDSSIPGINL